MRNKTPSNAKASALPPSPSGKSSTASDVSPGGQCLENLATRFHELLDNLFENWIVDWSLADARACAWIMEDTRRRGKPLDNHVADAFLAAAAASQGLAVVTRNSSEFRNTGVTAIDP